MAEPASVNIFYDERCLVPGSKAWDVIVNAANTTPVVVVVLSQEFACKEAPMAELSLFLDRFARDEVVIVPVFYSLFPDDCWAVQHSLYRDPNQWPADVPTLEQQDAVLFKSRQRKEVLQEWALLLQQLAGITGHRLDQTNYHEGKLAEEVSAQVLQHLVDMEVLPRTALRDITLHWGRFMLPSLTQHMVAREAELQDIVRGLCSRPGAAVVVAGPGEGKSTLAMQAGLEVFLKGGCPGGAFEVDLAGFAPDSEVADFLAMRLQLQLRKCKVLTAEDAAEWDMMEWLRFLPNGHVLLVLENAEDVLLHASEALQDVLQEIQSLHRRNKRNVLLLVNSRTQLGYSLDGGPTIMLESLPPEAAKKLLLKLSGEHTTWQEGQAAELVKMCRCNALLVTIIASFINAGRCTPESALAKFEETGRLTKVASFNRHQPRVEAEMLYKRRLATVWIQQLTLEEQHAVACLSVFRGSFTTAGAAAVMESAGVPDAMQLLQDLTTLSVLRAEQHQPQPESQPHEPRYFMHPLIRELGAELRAAASSNTAMQQLQPPPRRTAPAAAVRGSAAATAVAAAVAVLRSERRPRAILASGLTGLAVFVGLTLSRWHGRGGSGAGSGAHVLVEAEDRLVAWMLCNDEGPGQQLQAVGLTPGQVQALMAAEEPNFAEVARLLQHEEAACSAPLVMEVSEVGYKMRFWGYARQAQQLLQAVVKASTVALGAEHLATMVVVGGLGSTLTALGAPMQARQVLEEQVELYLKVLGPRHVDTLVARSNLGVALIDLGELEAARRLYEEVVHVHVELLGQHHSQFLTAMHNLASTLMHLDQLEEAQDLQEKLLVFCAAVHGERHEDTLSAMNTLGTILQKRHALDEAQELYEQVLRLRREVYGPQHPDALMAMNNLAVLQLQRGDTQAGIQQLLEVVEMRKQVLGPQHQHTFESMHSLAVALHAQGEPAAAQQLLEEVVKGHKATCGFGHPKTIQAMNRLAEMLLQQLGSAEALPVIEEMLELSNQAPGRDLANRFKALHLLGEILSQRGVLKRARAVQEEELEVAQQLFGHEHLHTLAALNNLGWTLRQLGDLESAQKLQRRQWELSRKLRGDEHADTLQAMNNLASTMRYQQQLDEALPLLVPALDVCKKALPREHICRRAIMNNLALTLHDLGNAASAQALLEDVLELQNEVEGRHHPNTLSMMEGWALTLERSGQLDQAQQLWKELLDRFHEVHGNHAHPDTMNALQHVLLLRCKPFNPAALAAKQRMQEQQLQVDKQLSDQQPQEVANAMHRLA